MASSGVIEIKANIIGKENNMASYCSGRIHVIIWPEYPIRYFAPSFDSRIKPQTVYFVFPASKTSEVEAARSIFSDRGIKTFLYPFKKVWDLAAVRSQAESLVKSMDSTDLILNLSSPSCPLTLGVYEVFRQKGLSIFTVNSEKDRLVWLSPEAKQSFDLEDHLDLQTYLKLYGFVVSKEIQRTPIPTGQRRLGKILTESPTRFDRSIHDLNWLSTEAKDSLLSPSINGAVSARESFQELLHLFGELNLLQVSNNQIEFPDEEARRFVSGGWLEDYVYSELRGLSGTGGLQDVARGVEFLVQKNGQPIRNELDVVFLSNNRLYFIECKTTKMNANHRKQNDFLYKLNSLKASIGGKRSRAMLLSYKPMGQRQRERAEVMGLEICCGNDVSKIKRWVQEWIQ